MKRQIFTRLIFMMFFIMGAIGVQAQPQPTYLCELRNDVQVSPTVYEFDIYIMRTGINAFDYAGTQHGITVNPTIKNSGTITAYFVTTTNGQSASNTLSGNCNSGLPFNAQPATIGFTAAQNCIKVSGKAGPGSGTFIVPNTSPGVLICRVRLVNTVAFGQASPNPTWNFTTTPYPSIVSAYYNNGTSFGNYPCTNNASHTTTNLVNPVLNVPTASTWTGTTNSDWFTATNWANTPVGSFPGATTAVTIPGASTNYPTITVAASCSSITINDGGSFIGAEFLTVGTATIHRTIANTQVHMLSSPVAGATFGNVFANSNTVWARAWNPLTNGWVYKTLSDPFVVGAGYSISTTTPSVSANFVGPFNKTAISSTLSNANGGWNLLGNPFQSAIDWDNVVKGSGIGAAVSVWNGANYITWNGTVGGLNGGIIPAENGFFASTTTDGATLTVPLEARVHSPIAFYKQSVANVLALEANGNDASDQMFIHFNNDATAGYDNQFDARKLWGADYAPQLYSMITNDLLAINELPMAGNETIDLGFSCNTNGEYSLTASAMESFEVTTSILLEDMKINTTQDLRANPVYNFSYVTGENANRFKLQFKSTTGINDLTTSGISVYSYDNNVIINNTTSRVGEIWVYDMTGRVLIHSTMSSNMTTRIPVHVAIGTYMVKVVTAKESVNHKVFIR